MSNIFYFTILNWNIGGAKYLETTEDNNQRDKIRKEINDTLKTLINRYEFPDVITLQEVVKYGVKEPVSDPDNAKDIIDDEELESLGYKYKFFPLIDTIKVSNKDKWQKVIWEYISGPKDKKSSWKARWNENTYFAQGNSILVKDTFKRYPIWDLSKIGNVEIPETKKDDHLIEQVNLDSGLYFGDRDTEPRAALIVHLITNPPESDKPLDIFVINVHLTTILNEREGIPKKDKEATDIRLGQIKTIFDGIISRYNLWRASGYLNRGKKRYHDNPEKISEDRQSPIWVIAGDFNFTPESLEYEFIRRMNFIDLVPNKGSGTKSRGVGKEPTLTLDYIFAGPNYTSLNPFVTEQGIGNNEVDHRAKGSDHYPIWARIPIEIPERDEAITKGSQQNLEKEKDDTPGNQ